MCIKRQFTECEMFAVHLADKNDPEHIKNMYTL